MKRVNIDDKNPDMKYIQHQTDIWGRDKPTSVVFTLEAPAQHYLDSHKLFLSQIVRVTILNDGWEIA